jgi:hypothetical protein
MAAVFMLVAGCNSPAGTYTVVEMGRTLAGITQVPRSSQEDTLEQYRERLTQRFANKTLKLSRDNSHNDWFAPSPSGDISGLINGRWTQGKSGDELVFHQWVSGPAYHPWGKAKREGRHLTVNMIWNTNVVLHLRK